MTIEELCKRSHDIAESKGWHERKRTMGEVIALFHSELSEALECFRDPSHSPGETWYSGEEHKPEGIVSELADLLIRIGDASIEMNLPLFGELYPETIGSFGHVCSDSLVYNGHKVTSFVDMLSIAHSYLSKSFDLSLLDINDHRGVACQLGGAMGAVGGICHVFHWDLEKAVIEKLEYNASRAHRHGGKRA